MEEERTLLVGFDLCDDYSQLSCIFKNAPEPESVCITPDQSKFLIPTAVCVREMTKDWVIGEEAERCRDRMAGVYVDKLLTRLENQEPVEIYGSMFAPEVLLEKYFRKVFGILRQRYQNNSIRQLVITLRDCTPATEERLYGVMLALGIDRDRVKIISHTTGFMYYIVSQPRDVWVNDVALFDYGVKGLRYCQLSFGRKGTPTAVVADCVDLSEDISFEMLSQMSSERLAHAFESIANLTLHKKIITSLFVTGRGFEGDWATDVLRRLCMGRRVFLGQNLYTKGACYAARAIVQNRLQEYCFLSEECIKASVSLRVYHDAQAYQLELASAGDNWKTAGTNCTLILDQCNELEFTVSDAVRKDKVLDVMTLDGPIRKERRSTRLQLNFRFINRDTAVVKLKDIGFGEFYKTNYRVWEQILKI